MWATIKGGRQLTRLGGQGGGTDQQKNRVSRSIRHGGPKRVNRSWGVGVRGKEIKKKKKKQPAPPA